MIARISVSLSWIIGLLALASCLGASSQAAEAPSFSLAWSEYPSWSVFGVADSHKVILGKEGELGPIEEKWGVDIVLKEADYDTCLVMYGANQCDGVCITNMDTLNPSLTRKSVAILPTSTSDGADALIVSKEITQVQDLKGKKVYGLAKTVSEYCFVRNLEILGEKEQDYTFTNMDPGAAAIAMQQKRSGFDAIVVWNPFVLETLNKRKDARVLFDSTSIPGEILDMVVVDQASLEKEGGEAFACAVIEAFYSVNQMIADPQTRDDTLVALGEKFSNLNLQAMRKVVQQTQFYATPEEGLELLKSPQLPQTMKKVTDFCVSHEIVPEEPKVGFGSAQEAGDVNFRLDPSFIQKAAKK